MKSSTTSRAAYTAPFQGSRNQPSQASAYVPPIAKPIGATQEHHVICSPHFDDAALSCWSLLARDSRSTVVNVFTGAPGSDFTYWYDQLNGAQSSALHMQERLEEDRHALSVVNKLPIDLGLLERQYRLRPSPWLHQLFRRAPLLRFALLRMPLLHTALHSIAPPAVDQLADAIMAAVPGATTFWVPAGIGGHTDHLLVRQAGELLAGRGLKVRLYADMPYLLRYGWPQWLASGKERAMDRASAYWANYLDGLFTPEKVTQRAQIVHLTPAERLHKAEAIRRYATQFDSVGAGRMRGWLRKEDALAYEVFWELNSPAAKAVLSR